MYANMEIIGFIASAERKRTTDGKDFWTLSIANNKKFKVNGKETEQTTWYNVSVFFENLVHLLDRPLTLKGAFVRITGEPQARAWQDQRGGWHASLDVTADSVRFLRHADGAKSSPESAKGEGEGASEPPPYEPDDAIPF